MAETTQTILEIKVDSAQAVQAIADYSAKIELLKQRESELKKEIAKSGDITGEQANKLAQLGEQRKAYTRLMQESSKEVQNNIKASKSQEGSLKSLRGELANLTKQYDELGRAERESAEGKDLQAKINAITGELKKGEEGTTAVGDNRNWRLEKLTLTDLQKAELDECYADMMRFVKKHN